MHVINTSGIYFGGFKRLLGFQFLVFWAHGHMSLQGEFHLQADVLTTWPSY